MKTNIRPIWGDGGPGVQEQRNSGWSGWCILGYGAVDEVLVFPTHGYIDEGEDVVFDHDGETEEDGVQHQHINTQLKVQLPPVQVDPKNLQVKKMKK